TSGFPNSAGGAGGPWRVVAGFGAEDRGGKARMPGATGAAAPGTRGADAAGGAGAPADGGSRGGSRFAPVLALAASQGAPPAARQQAEQQRQRTVATWGAATGGATPRTATKRGTTPGTAATWGTATSPRMDLEAEVTKLCEEQKKLAAKSWQKPLAELTKKLSDEERKQQVLLGQQGQAMLRSFVRPPALHTMGFIRAGMAPKEIYQRLAGHYHHHRQRMFSEFFTPVLGNHRNAHVLPMLPEWIMEGGFIDSLLRPMVEKFAGKKLALVNVHPGIRIYKEGATLMRHVDSPERPITVALAIGAAGAGGSWHLELSDPHGNQWRPLPLTMGHMLIYEGVRIAHGRAGPLASGELAMAFAYYRPKENYDAPRLQRHVEQMVSSAPRPTSASQGQAPEFRSVDEL
ncbi:unnamed protein product, partial [Effrenium voratum]